MKQLFFDAAYMGKLHWNERGSAEVLALATTAEEIVCSHHGRAEFCSIGFRKVREGLAAPANFFGPSRGRSHVRTKANPIGVAACALQSKLPGEQKGKLPTAKRLANIVRAEMEGGK